MALDFNGTTQYLNRANEVLTPGNMSMSCWFNTDANDGNDRRLVTLSHTSTASRMAGIQLGPAAAPPQLYTQVINNAVGINHRSTVATEVTNGVWHHAGGTFTSTSSVITYLDGVAGAAVQTVSGAIATTNSLQIGVVNFGGSLLQYYDGKIAEVGIWNVVLTAAEMLVLSKGFSPLFVRRANLVGYWPLHGRFSPEPMYGGVGVAGVSQELTLVNTPAFFSHPNQIIYPSTIFTPFMPAVEGEGGAALIHRLMMMGCGQ